MDASLNHLFAKQDDLITRQQALSFLSEEKVRARLGRTWGIVLPGVYSASTDPPTYRQRLRAALLHAGPTSMLNDTAALAAHRVPYLPADDRVRVLIADRHQRISRDFVVVRRTTRLPTPVVLGGFPVAPAHRAVCEFVARHTDERDGLAVGCAAVQLGRVSMAALCREALAGAPRGRPRLLRVIEMLEAGVRSAPEADFRQLVLRSRRLAEPLWNCLLQLPEGTRISPDALWVGSALVHEVNGRRYHSPELAGEDAFEDMQRRNDALVTAGFTVLHNSPSRIRAEGRAVINEVASCAARDAGRGLPPGVVILRREPASAYPSNVTALGRFALRTRTSPQ